MHGFIVDWIIFFVLMFSPALVAGYATRKYLARKKARRG